MNDLFVSIWVIIESDGIILVVYCLGCKVGFVELCLYIVSVLFYIEVWICINGKLVCI